MSQELNSLSNIDLYGYFLYHTKFYSNHKEFFLSLFQPQIHIKNHIQSSLNFLRKQGKTIVGIHIRRGDFGAPPFYIAPISWYKDYLNNLWQTLYDPILFIASDEISKSVEDFA